MKYNECQHLAVSALRITVQMGKGAGYDNGKEDLLRSLIEAYLMEKGHACFIPEPRKRLQILRRKNVRELSDWEERI